MPRIWTLMLTSSSTSQTSQQPIDSCRCTPYIKSSKSSLLMASGILTDATTSVVMHHRSSGSHSSHSLYGSSSSSVASKHWSVMSMMPSRSPKMVRSAGMQRFNIPCPLIKSQYYTFGMKSNCRMLKRNRSLGQLSPFSDLKWTQMRWQLISA